MTCRRFAVLLAVLSAVLSFCIVSPAAAGPGGGGSGDGKETQLSALEKALKQMGDVLAQQDPYGPVDAEVMSRLADYIADIHTADIAAQAGKLLEAWKAKGNETNAQAADRVMDMLNELNRVTKASGLGTISATESWPITRMMVFGTKNVLTADGTSHLSRTGLQPKIFFDAVMGEVVRTISGNKEASDVDVKKILDEIAEFYREKLRAAQKEAARRPGAGSGGGFMFEAYQTWQVDVDKAEKDLKDLQGASLDDFNRRRIKNAARRQALIDANLEKMREAGGLVGVSGGAAKDTIYTRMRLIALVVLFSAFFARILFMLLGSVIGSSRHGTLGPLALAFKMLFLILMILAIPNIAVFGMKTSDIIRSFLLDPGAAHSEYTPGQQTSLALAELDDLITLRYRLHGSGEQVDQTTFADWFAGGFIFIVGVCASAIVGAMLILGDVMMGITCCTGALVLAMSMVPSCEKWTEHAAKAWLTYLIFAPMTSLFIIAMRILFSLTGGMTILTFVIVCVVCIKLMSDLPKMCESMSSAVMTGVVATLALTPGRITMAGTQFTLQSGVKGAAKLGKWAYSKVF